MIAIICRAGRKTTRIRTLKEEEEDGESIPYQCSRDSGVACWNRTIRRRRYRKPQSELNSEVSGYDAIRIGEVSVADLSVSEANRLALELPRNAPAVEQPKHRLPNGRPTSQPSPETLHALPATEPNVGVAAAKAQANFTSVKGFTGIFEGNNVTVNHSELEPPDQGLAVHNNVAAEINNNVVRFFNATTGAAMSPPMAASAFFNAAGYDLTDTRSFTIPFRRAGSSLKSCLGLAPRSRVLPWR